MRFCLTLLTLLIVAAAPARANETRIKVRDLNNFIKEWNNAINNNNANVTRNFLDRVVTDSAVFNNYVMTRNHPQQWQAWYGHPAYNSNYYYRYPMNPYYTPSSRRSLSKWDHINMLESKKRMIPGYSATAEITDTHIQPYGAGAVVDVDLMEYSMAYAPYRGDLTNKVMHSNSRCKLYLSQGALSDLYVTRMDCNTNTNLPF